jgi:hypothetical protein
VSREVVDAAITRARLRLSDEEYERLVRQYALIQEQMAALRLAEARYLEPAVIYSAAGT